MIINNITNQYRWRIREVNKKKRVDWCQRHLHRTDEEWLRVVWTDESSYSTKGFGHRPLVLRRADEEYHPDCIDEIWESGRKSQMVWGAFCRELKSELFFVKSGAKIDSESYTKEILDPLLFPFWHQACEHYGWTIVMEVGAPGHKGVSKICREMNNVESLGWVPQSPDLNLIEELWGDIEVELGEKYGYISDINLVMKKVKEEWGYIPKSRLLSLVSTMRRRLERIIAVG